MLHRRCGGCISIGGNGPSWAAVGSFCQSEVDVNWRSLAPTGAHWRKPDVAPMHRNAPRWVRFAQSRVEVSLCQPVSTGVDLCQARDGRGRAVGSFCQIEVDVNRRSLAPTGAHWRKPEVASACGGMHSGAFCLAQRSQRSQRSRGAQRRSTSCFLCALCVLCVAFFSWRGRGALHLFRRAALLSRQMRSARGQNRVGGPKKGMKFWILGRARAALLS